MKTRGMHEEQNTKQLKKLGNWGVGHEAEQQRWY